MMWAFFGEWKQMEYQIMVLSQNGSHLNESEIYIKPNWQLYSEPEIIFAWVVYNKRVWKDYYFFFSCTDFKVAWARLEMC